ncbi:MAG: VanZ family protein [Anaerolineae bacterium]|nr:VanZ family protein [Anaerolineae bacterium]
MPTRRLLSFTAVRVFFGRWGPALALMILILISSAQPKLPPPDGDPAAVYFSGLIPIFAGLWEVLLKKTAHVLMYGLLAALYMRGLTGSGMDARRAGYLSVVLAFLYALTDELHQGSVPGRTASGIDIGLDFTGATLATLFMRRRQARDPGRRAERQS